jgi:hypothetical protein
MPFVEYRTAEDVEKFQKYTESVAEHFGSDTMAEKYLNGLIDWNGNELCDYHGSGPCDCNLHY